MRDQIQVKRDQVTAFTLSRQGLLEPFSRRSVGQVVERIGVVHGQIPATGLIQLWARVKDFRPDDFWSALYLRRTIVRTWAMRGTLHMIPSTRLGTYLSAIGPHWLYFWSWLRRRVQESLTPEDLDCMRKVLAKAFQEEPMTRRELRESVQHPAVEKVVSKVRWEAIWRLMSYWGDIVHGEMRGPEVVFHDAKDWLGRPVRLYDDAVAGAELLDIYLRTLGPASLSDFGYWTGLRMSEVNAAFEQLKRPVVEVLVGDSKKPLLLRRRDVKALESAEISENHVRLLPQLEPIILGHRDRSRFIDKEHYGPVFGVTADVKATLLVDGRLAGTWRHVRRGKALQITMKPFQRLAPSTKAELRQLAADLMSFLEFEEMDLVFT